MTQQFKVGDKVSPKKDMLAPGSGWAAYKGATVTEVGRKGEWDIEVTDSAGRKTYAATSEFELTKPARDYVADHARRTLRAAGLTAEQAKKFVANVQRIKAEGGSWFSDDGIVGALCSGEDGDELDLSKMSRGLQGVKLSDLIHEAFSWRNTTEGQVYWDTVYVSLKDQGK